MARYSVQERGQEYPTVIGPMSFPMRLWYELLVHPWFKRHQKRHPWHWRVWDNVENTWVTDYQGKPREFWHINQADDWANMLERMLDPYR